MWVTLHFTVNCRTIVTAREDYLVPIQLMFVYFSHTKQINKYLFNVFITSIQILSTYLPTLTYSDCLGPMASDIDIFELGLEHRNDWRNI